jgi:hypothetical protein
VAATESATTTATMPSGQGIRRNRHRADQQSRSRHSTKITFHEYLQWFDRLTNDRRPADKRTSRQAPLNCSLES